MTGMFYTGLLQVPQDKLAATMERQRAEVRAGWCKSRVARYPAPGTERHDVRVDGREVGYLARAGQAPLWCATWTAGEAPEYIGTDHGKPAALMLLKVRAMLEAERRVVSELDLAVALTRDIFPQATPLRGALKTIRAALLDGSLSPAVATMNAAHVLAHVTGVGARR